MNNFFFGQVYCKLRIWKVNTSFLIQLHVNLQTINYIHDCKNTIDVNFIKCFKSNKQKFQPFYQFFDFNTWKILIWEIFLKYMSRSHILTLVKWSDIKRKRDVFSENEIIWFPSEGSRMLRAFIKKGESLSVHCSLYISILIFRISVSFKF